MPTQRLEPYRKKRDFARTAEPTGTVAPDSGNRFVVHKHHATADHYDLRLETGGVLKSWAVPKGPSLNPEDKRLAVETEDHPIEYIDFEGVIPKGEYGGGPMIVWDAGVWAPMEDVETSLKKGAFKFRLSGEKLKGGWMLARLKSKPGEEKRNWLLFKERDPFASAELDILAERPESVKSGLRIEELVAPDLPAKPKVLRPGRLPGAVKAPMPARVEPQLATSVAKPPSGDDWLHEIKFDGYRTMAHVAQGSATFITRSGLDWTKRYRDLAAAFAKLPCRQAVIDGEIVVLDEQGVSRFALLQDALAKGESHRLTFFAFDLLYLDGWDLTGAPLDKRKQLLSDLLAGQVTARSSLQISGHIAGDGKPLYDRAAEMGLEGIVSKRASAPYASGRSATWSKIKALSSGDFVIAGYTTSQAAEGLAALALARVGRRRTALSRQGRHRLRRANLAAASGAARTASNRRRAAGPHAQGHNPGAPGADGPHTLCKPDGRQGATPRRVQGTAGSRTFGSGSSQRKRLILDADLAAIWVTNPTRRLFGKSGPTKLDIAVYYAAVGDFMLPHILGRPVSLVRCPTGRAQDCFFQRHPFAGMPPTIASFETKNSEDETQTYISVEDVKGYLALAQFGVVEFHVWGVLSKHLDRPDRMVFDLDPGEGINWREVVEAAIHVRAELRLLGLEPFVKTSGGRGVHVVAPTAGKLGWKQFHQAAGEISSKIAATAPDTFTTVMGKENRKKRIFIDFHRNARSATAVAPFSLRNRAHMPVSTPLSWTNLESIDAPEDLNYSSVPSLLETTGDPWADINDFARELPLLVQVKS